jgi:hypothetical protein
MLWFPKSHTLRKRGRATLEPRVDGVDTCESTRWTVWTLAKALGGRCGHLRKHSVDGVDTCVSTRWTVWTLSGMPRWTVWTRCRMPRWTVWTRCRMPRWTVWTRCRMPRWTVWTLALRGMPLWTLLFWHLGVNMFDSIDVTDALLCLLDCVTLQILRSSFRSLRGHVGAPCVALYGPRADPLRQQAAFPIITVLLISRAGTLETRVDGVDTCVSTRWTVWTIA